MKRALLPLALILAVPLYPQAPQSDGQTLQALLAEVQRLRLAIERSTLLGARTQISILLLQTQEARTAKISGDLERIRSEISRFGDEAKQGTNLIKHLEERISQATNPGERTQFENEIKAMKNRIEDAAARQTQMRAQEAEVSSQLQAERSRLTQLQSQISEMERAIDAAIGQMTAQ